MTISSPPRKRRGTHEWGWARIMAELSVIGLSHQSAPVEVRERLALPGDQVGRLLRTFKAEPALEEAVVLSTCNRTELYSVPRRGHDPLEYFLARLAHLKGDMTAVNRSAFYRHDGTAAARHIFRVAAALDSQIVGEHQILGQVKTAYQEAVEARTTGFLLNRLMHWSFRVGKRVQTETQLGRGSAGVATAAVELARHIFSTLDGRTVLLVGAGQTAECAAKALLRAGAGRLVVANRTLYRAQQLAYDLLHKPADAMDEPCDDAEVEGPACPALLKEGQEEAPAPPVCTAPDVTTDAIGLEDLAGALSAADLVITSTASPEPVLRFDALAPVLERRGAPSSSSTSPSRATSIRDWAASTTSSSTTLTTWATWSSGTWSGAGPRSRTPNQSSKTRLPGSRPGSPRCRPRPRSAC